MTESELRELFEKHDDEYIKFERVENKRSNRPDLHAFLLLDELFPADSDSDIICAAEHDEIYLDITVEQLAGKVTEAEVIELTRCGVRCGEERLEMFV